MYICICTCMQYGCADYHTVINIYIHNRCIFSIYACYLVHIATVSYLAKK